MNRVLVLGAGSWGLTVGKLLCEKGIRVDHYEHDPDRAARLADQRRDESRLPGVALPPEPDISADLARLTEGAELLVVAVPAQAVRKTLKGLPGGSSRKLVLLSKGIERGTGRRMSEVAEETLPGCTAAVLSGPNIAREIAAGLPAAAVAASADAGFASEVARLFGCDSFRVYTSEDVPGVELGGALKNVTALAAGMADGLGLGANAKGALLTRGVAEMARLGVKLGAKPLTFSGLSGAGDLITTSISSSSRNRYVGEELGKGRQLSDVLSGMEMVAEGVKTTSATVVLARERGVDVPIADNVNAVLEGKLSAREAVQALLSREQKQETYGLSV